ncbi:MAG: lysine--tRNA ligase [Spirochaetales bacterium]|nr:lysine--tRNA ligase [Spirochaetales bacterium]
MIEKPEHWADQFAQAIINKRGEKEQYVCASGITPSGTVHIGNFREIISVDLIVRALRRYGKKVRFIYSWDDYDVFRKIPKNMPNQEMLQAYLRKPIIKTPDPFGQESSYARRNEKDVEKMLPLVGIVPEYIYQAEKYMNSDYAEGMKTALEHKAVIIEILNQHRQTPLDESWWPISVFCNKCDLDTTQIKSWDGNYSIDYACTSCGNEETLDLRKTGNVKLFWRVDWPMRWKYEGVDFEPAGKEHHSAGGSFDTAKEIVQRVYAQDEPNTFKYDFISIKGQGGKISSSLGNVLSLEDVLQIYQPQIVRYLFAGTRPNTEFAISFDLDVIKIYEDYDRCERFYYGAEEISDKKKAKEARNYELSQIDVPAEKMPYQMAFRHLCNLLQINDGNIEGVLEGLELSDIDKKYVTQRAACAWNWIENYAPEDFKFRLRAVDAPESDLNSKEREALQSLAHFLDQSFKQLDEKALGEKIYEIAQSIELDPKEFFRVCYEVLIGKEKGPRLAGFILTIGQNKIMSILGKYL